MDTRAQQLAEHVDRSAGPDACWPWTLRTTERGYGALKLSKQFKGRGETRVAHRHAWELHHGLPAPAGLVVRHTCDNAPCCNPAHLVLGTERDNVYDAIERGRRRYVVGSKAARAKLNELQVFEIRTALAAGASVHDLANEYGVTVDNIRCIRDWKTWRHVTAEGVKLAPNQISGALEEGVRLVMEPHPFPLGPPRPYRKTRLMVSERQF